MAQIHCQACRSLHWTAQQPPVTAGSSSPELPLPWLRALPFPGHQEGAGRGRALLAGLGNHLNQQGKFTNRVNFYDLSPNHIKPLLHTC